MKTRAAVYEAAGQPMIIDEIELPAPGPEHVLVKHYATGICHSQLHELHRPDPAVPMVLGHESTGVVLETGSAVKHVKPGDNVMVTWVPRGANPASPPPVPAAVTHRGRPIAFGLPDYTGVFTWSEHTLVDQQMVVPLEAGIATDVTAVIGCAVMTGVGAAVNAAQVRPGDSVAIFGAGGVGLCIVQACANLQAHPIIAVDVTNDKLEFARQFGATHTVNSAQEDAVARIRQLTGDRPDAGVDYAFDAIGIKQTTEQALLAARARRLGERQGGVAVLVGVPHGPAARLDVAAIFRGKTYRGAPGGCSRPDRDFPMLLRWFRQGKLPLDQLVTRRYKLEQINDACAALEHGEITGRAIVVF